MNKILFLLPLLFEHLYFEDNFSLFSEEII
jgi:hypothetical protein